MQRVHMLTINFLWNSTHLLCMSLFKTERYLWHTQLVGHLYDLSVVVVGEIHDDCTSAKAVLIDTTLPFWHLWRCPGWKRLWLLQTLYMCDTSETSYTAQVAFTKYMYRCSYGLSMPVYFHFWRRSAAGWMKIRSRKLRNIIEGSHSERFIQYLMTSKWFP